VSNGTFNTLLPVVMTMIMSQKPTIVLLGANGKIGKRVLLGLLHEAQEADQQAEDGRTPKEFKPFTVQAVVRSKDRLMEIPPEYSPHLEVIEASIQEEQDASKIQTLVRQSQVTVSCLGHGKDIFKKSQANLLLGSIKLLHGALTPNNRLICLNGAAARHPDRTEGRGWIEWAILSLLSWLVPAHADMERTLEYLYNEHQMDPLSSNKHWIVVRPGLFAEDPEDANIGSPRPSYSFTSHREVGLFSGRVCSVSNVADSIVKLAINDGNLQEKWDGEMPVVLDDVMPKN
jgi:NAD(P)H-binding